MKVLVTGPNGFIGKKVVEALKRGGHQTVELTRKQWEAGRNEFPAEALNGVDGVIHLAGEPVSQRWNAAIKDKIRDSRVAGTQSLVSAIRRVAKPPSVLVSASAIGFYADRGEEVLSERSPKGTGFLADVSADWETAALDAQAAGVRVSTVRIGIVLGAGGALKAMLPAFRLGAGGTLGQGKQWMSWIYVNDVVRLFVSALDNPSISGPLNGVAPVPVRNSEFTAALAKAVHRPAVIPVPQFALKLLFGEMADVMLASQRVLPKAAESYGFHFEHREIRPALAAAVADFRA